MRTGTTGEFGGGVMLIGNAGRGGAERWGTGTSSMAPRLDQAICLGGRLCMMNVLALVACAGTVGDELFSDLGEKVRFA